MQISTKKRNNISSILIFCGISVISTYLLLFVPISRQIGLIFRNTLYILPVVFLFPFISTLVRNTYIRAILFGFLFLIFLLPLSGLWNSGLSGQYSLGGVIPWSDAFTLHMNTLRFLYGQFMGQSTALRPISPVFYASILKLSDNNFILLSVVITILCSITVLSCTNLLGKKFGPVVAAFFYTNAFFYIRWHEGELMTELYGFFTGMLACYFLLSGILCKKNWEIIFGLSLFSLALNARPGPMFVLLFAGAWFLLVQLHGHKKRLLFSVAALIAILSGFIINRWNTSKVYMTSTVPNRQIAEIVYALCLGGHSWDYVLTMPEIQALNDSENVYGDLFRMCTKVLRENPENLLLAAKRITGALLFDNEKGAFSYFNGGDVIQNSIVRYGLGVLWFLGFLYMLKRKRLKIFSFLLYCAVGMILSQGLGLVITTNRLRFHAATIWIPGIIIGFFPQFLFSKIFHFRENETESSPSITDLSTGIAIIGYVLLLSSLISPFLLHRFPEQAPSSMMNPCKEGKELLTTKIDEGSYFYMEDSENLEKIHYPYFRLPYVRQHFHDTASVEMFDFTDHIDKPTAIIRGIDLDNWKDALIFAPLDIVKGKTGYVQFCGNYLNPPILRNDRFFIPTEAFFLGK